MRNGMYEEGGKKGSSEGRKKGVFLLLDNILLKKQITKFQLTCYHLCLKNKLWEVIIFHIVHNVC